MRLVLFDCDGTLLDSQYVICLAMQRAFERLDLEWPGREKTLSVVGLSIPESMKVLAPAVDEEIRALLGQRYREASYALRHEEEFTEPLFDGAREILQTLHARDDVLLGIATGKSRRGLRAMLEREAMAEFFVTLQTADDAPSKPHPAMVHQAMSEAGVGHLETVVVGDTSYDIAMARAAGAGALGVSWGYHPVAHLHAAGAHDVISDFNELPKAVDSILELL